MRAVEICFFRNIVCELTCRRGWLDSIHVEPRPNVASLHCVRQSCLVDYFTTRRVDEVSALAHCAKEFRPDESFSLRFKRQMHANDVRLAGDFGGLTLVFDTKGGG